MMLLRFVARYCTHAFMCSSGLLPCYLLGAYYAMQDYPPSPFNAQLAHYFPHEWMAMLLLLLAYSASMLQFLGWRQVVRALNWSVLVPYGVLYAAYHSVRQFNEACALLAIFMVLAVLGACGATQWMLKDYALYGARRSFLLGRERLR